MTAVHYELIIKGNQEILCAYLQGFLNGKNIKQGVIFSKDYPLKIPHLIEMIKYHGGVSHIICRAGLRASVTSAIKRAPAEYEFEIKKARPISQALFRFEFETFSRKVAGRIKRAFTLLPRGIELKGYKPMEKIIPEAVGPEGYAPMHDYRFAGAGEVAGDVEGLLAFHRKLSRNEFIELEEIVLHY